MAIEKPPKEKQLIHSRPAVAERAHSSDDIQIWEVIYANI